MRRCNMCGVYQSLESFNFRNKAAGTRGNTCKECFRVYRQEHYRQNRATYIARNNRNTRRRVLTTMARLWGYLAEHPCVDCGESDPLVLEFDHIEPASKRQTVHWMVYQAYGWETIMTEIAKCEVRCANCHRRRTARQFGWAKLAFSQP